MHSLLKKFDLIENDFLKYVEILAPENVVKDKVKTISNIVNSENAQKTDDEWRELCHINFKEHNLTEENKLETFWEIILKTKLCNS